jgi:hypothetical protein
VRKTSTTVHTIATMFPELICAIVQRVSFSEKINSLAWTSMNVKRIMEIVHSNAKILRGRLNAFVTMDISLVRTVEVVWTLMNAVKNPSDVLMIATILPEDLIAPVLRV